MLCDYHHYVIPEHFPFPTKKPCAFQQFILFPLFPHLLATINLFSIFNLFSIVMDLQILDITYKSNDIIGSFVCLASFT